MPTSGVNIDFLPEGEAFDSLRPAGNEFITGFHPTAPTPTLKLLRQLIIFGSTKADRTVATKTTGLLHGNN